MSKISKLISKILRHEPELVGLALGAGGWVPLVDLIQGMKRMGVQVTPAEIATIVATNDKRRFTLSTDGRRIRAAQGHSVLVDLQLQPSTPPDELFHGTASANLDAIFDTGINPGRRMHVHLSTDRGTAIAVGQRHGAPIVLHIDTRAMHDDGHVFWVADNGVWLTLAVPPKFIGFA